MEKWREPVFVLILIVGLYGLYLSMPIFSLPPTLAYLCGSLYAVFAVFRLRKDFHDHVSGGVVRFLGRLLIAGVLAVTEFATTVF